MKCLLTILLYSITVLGCYAQVLPQAINFQGVARADNGKLIKNTVIGLRLTIIDKADGNKEIYREKHADTTDAYGFFSLQIGRPISVDKLLNSVDFVDIPWQTGDKLLKIEFDTTAGQTFPINLGTIEMITVPFAFSAESVTNIRDKNAQNEDALIFDGTNWVPGRGMPKVRTITVSDSLLSTDDVLLADASSNDIVVRLPSPTSSNRLVRVQALNGKQDVWILSPTKKSIKLPQASVDTIKLSRSGDFVELYPNGTSWLVLRRKLQIRAEARHANFQSIPHATNTYLNFNQEYSDWSNHFDNSKATYKVPPGGSGQYTLHIWLQANHHDWDKGEAFLLRYQINSNGKFITYAKFEPLSGVSSESGNYDVNGSFTVYLDEGDQLSLACWQGSGVSIDIQESRMVIYRVPD